MGKKQEKEPKPKKKKVVEVKHEVVDVKFDELLPKAKLRSFFLTNELIRNSDIREMLELGKTGHRAAGTILRAHEAAGHLKKAKVTKQAAFYKPGPAL